MLLAAGSGEYRSIHETGLPACIEILDWSEWAEGSGGLKPSHIREGIDPDAEIVAYRTASKKAIATEYTFYQAKYRSRDGSVRIDHADGPRPLIDQNWTVLYASLGVGVPAGIALLVITFRVGPRPPAVGAEGVGRTGVSPGSPAYHASIPAHPWRSPVFGDNHRFPPPRPPGTVA